MSEEAPVRPGDLLLGKFRVERILGRGGMGVVVAASHVALDERVAIKFLLPELLGKREVVSRFAREARASAKIRSEHVARVTDVGAMENGAPYMVMEYLEGTDLAALVARDGPLSVHDAVEYVLQACEALAEAHAIGIVHRDLKPANLFLTRRADGTPCVKLLDFGISKMRSDGSEALTHTGSGMIGSPVYMSPEQLASAKDVDARTDVYALGLALFELLTGERPFDAPDLPRLVYQILHSPPRSLRSLRPDAPEGLERTIERCLAKTAATRVPSVAHLAAMLVEFAPPRARLSAERIARIAERTNPGSQPNLLAALPVETSTSISASGNASVDPLDRTAHALSQPVPTRAAPAPWKLATLGAAGVLVIGVAIGAFALRSRGEAPVTGASPPAKPTETHAAPPEKPASAESAPTPPATSASAKPAATPSATSTTIVPILPKPKPKLPVKPKDNPFPKKVE